MRRSSLLLLMLLGCFLLLPSVQAQGANPLIVDDGLGLDSARISTAARPLIDQGARVVVVGVQEPNTGTAQDYLDEQLNQRGIARSASPSDLPADVIIFFVSVNPPESAIWFGRNFSSALSGQTENLRKNSLNPQLRQSRFTQGFVDVMTATATTINNPIAVRTPETEPAGNATMIMVGLIAVGVLAFFVVPAFLKRRSASQEVASAAQSSRQRYEQAKRAAGIAIADLGQLMNDSRAKQKFDKVSYPQTQVRDLEQRQQEAESRFHQLQVQFDDIGERLEPIQSPSVTDLEGAAGGYDGVQAQAQEVSRMLREMDALRKQLDAISAQAPAEVDRAKKS